jgi:uncharacterized membrane protein YccC
LSRREWAWVVVAAGLCLTFLAPRLLPYDVFLALVGVLIGAAISGAISWHIYQRSSDELRQEAEKLRRLTLKLIEILAASGQIEVSTRDPETGEPTSWPVGIKGGILFDVKARPPSAKPRREDAPPEQE